MITCSMNAKQLPCSYHSSRVIYPFIHLVTWNHCSAAQGCLTFFIYAHRCAHFYSVYLHHWMDQTLFYHWYYSSVLCLAQTFSVSPLLPRSECSACPGSHLSSKISPLMSPMIDYLAGCTSPLSWKTNPSASWKRQTVIHEKLLFWSSALPNEGFQWKPNLKICEA